MSLIGVRVLDRVSVEAQKPWKSLESYLNHHNISLLRHPQSHHQQQRMPQMLQHRTLWELERKDNVTPSDSTTATNAAILTVRATEWKTRRANVDPQVRPTCHHNFFLLSSSTSAPKQWWWNNSCRDPILKKSSIIVFNRITIRQKVFFNYKVFKSNCFLLDYIFCWNIGTILLKLVSFS